MPDRWHVLHPLSAFVLAAAASAITALSPSEVAVVEIRRPEIAGATLRVELYSGSAEDPAGKEGLASLTAAILCHEAADLGSSLDGTPQTAVGKDVAVFTVETSPASLPRWIDILRAVLAKPALEAASLESQRARQEQVVDAARHDTETLSREAFDAFVFRGHPYAHAACGKSSSLAALTRDDVVGFHAAHYRKGNMAVGLAGGLKDSWIEIIRNGLAALPDGEPSRALRPVSWLARPRVLVIQDSATTTLSVRIGHPLNVTRAHPDYAGLSLVREGLRAALPGVEPALETDDGGAVSLPRRQQAFVMRIQAAGAAEAARSTRAALMALEAVVRNGLDASGMDRAIQLAKANPVAGAADHRGELAARLDEILWRAPGFGGRLIASIEAISAQATREIAARSLFPDRVAIVVVAPDARAFAEAMLAGGPGPALAPDDIEILDSAEIFR